MKKKFDDEDDLRDKIRFDRDSLDDAIEEQAELFLQAGDAHALAVSRRDAAKSNMDDEHARACDRARDNLGDKKTEPQVKEMAQQDKKYKLAEQQFLDAKLAADQAAVLRESFEMRGKMLQQEAQLFIAGYYQVARVSGKVRGEVADIENSVHRAKLHKARLERRERK